MKRKLVCGLSIFFMCLTFTSCGVLEAIVNELSQPTEQVKYNPLRGTSWQSEDLTGGIGSFVGVYMSLYIDFGDTNFKKSTQTISNGIDMRALGMSNDETGTYTISGDNISLTFSDGSQLFGTLIGNSLELDGVRYFRIQ